VGKQPCRHQFWHNDRLFFPKKNTVDEGGDKIDNDVNKFYFFIFLDFLAASNAMVTDVGGVRRSIFAICTI
jgi:hypothetical protein